ncbi:23S rRNA pseudouridine955/2504/2580 synthase [Tistlia consotensis]|uniref:Pseudouridine synthase n=1 Tax=Tistlia consotensis USBA 355 TaxID=560819 RepID=A0A1Y6CAJ9_9PROT|nr:RluA family pseudouridine synthase [Tistlia consotensis]SMF43147.1 23S rRNA pseudouridine955/2504/2580 synthase [Tistlia consotensis USBA 355]SNR42286.1 23S rRNA pseudouridine955/2504/2580 synthase [Tistlia consotensis]
MSGVETRLVEAGEGEQRLDRWFRKHYPAVTFGHLAKLLRTGQVRVDGKRAQPSTRLAEGQAVRVPPLGGPSGGPGAAVPAAPQRAETPLSEAEAEALRARVLYRDDWIIALDKPAGLAVQGGSGQTRHLDAMLDALMFEAVERPRLVHRLDRDTAGVLLLARTAEAARRLGEAFRQEGGGEGARKIYWALVAGVPPKKRSQLDLPLGKEGGPGKEKVRTGAADAKPARTRYHLIDSHARKASFVALRPLTGRTHQLRVHMAALGCPILGDGKYGGRQAFLDRPALPKQLMLLARELAVPHPEDGTTVRFTAPIPPHFAEALAALRFDPEGPAVERAALWLEG